MAYSKLSPHSPLKGREVDNNIQANLVITAPFEGVVGELI
jgi:hypothetical protein